jgi:hypothetical protein
MRAPARIKPRCERQWIGTAPMCGAGRFDCPAGWEPIVMASGAPGSQCGATETDINDGAPRGGEWLTSDWQCLDAEFGHVCQDGAKLLCQRCS